MESDKTYISGKNHQSLSHFGWWRQILKPLILNMLTAYYIPEKTTTKKTFKEMLPQGCRKPRRLILDTENRTLQITKQCFENWTRDLMVCVDLKILLSLSSGSQKRREQFSSGSQTPSSNININLSNWFLCECAMHNFLFWGKKMHIFNSFCYSSCSTLFWA